MLMKSAQHRGHMHKWKEFPGLEAVVRQVSGIDWSDLQAAQIPGGPFNFHVPKFDEPSPGNTEATPSGFVTISLTVKDGPVQNHIVDEVKSKVKDEIKEEDEVKIKHEPEDEPGMPVDIGPPERPPSPESATLDHESEVPRHPYGSLDQTGFGDCPPELPIHWMPQPSSLQQFGCPPGYWHGMPNPYFPPQFPTLYPLIPYYNFDVASFGSDSQGGRLNHQFPNHPQFHVIPEHLSVSVPAPPGISPNAFLPPPLFPPPSLPPTSSIPSSRPSPAPSLPTPSPPMDVVAKQPDEKLGGKRKLSNSLGSSSEPSRPLKRRMLAQGGNMSEDNDLQYSGIKLPGPGSGLPDFGTWFQGQVADRKKKLSHLERACTPNGNRNDA